MNKNEIVEVGTPQAGKSATSRRVLVATLSIQKFRLSIYQDADPAMIEKLIKLILEGISPLPIKRVKPASEGHLY